METVINHLNGVPMIRHGFHWSMAAALLATGLKRKDVEEAGRTGLYALVEGLRAGEDKTLAQQHVRLFLAQHPAPLQGTDHDYQQLMTFLRVEAACTHGNA